MAVPKDAHHFVLRLPPGLRDQVKEAADRNLRSMNSEIVFQLQRVVADDGARNEKGSVSA